MENTEKFRMRKYLKQTGTNIYAAHGRGVNQWCNQFIYSDQWLYIFYHITPQGKCYIFKFAQLTYPYKGSFNRSREY